MDGKFVIFLVPISLVVSTAYVITELFNFKLKKHLIDAGHVDKEAARFFTRRAPEAGQSMLKWGLILFFGGLGLILIEFLPYRGDRSPLPFGIELVFISIGFLIYYFAKKEVKNDPLKN